MDNDKKNSELMRNVRDRGDKAAMAELIRREQPAALQFFRDTGAAEFLAVRFWNKVWRNRDLYPNPRGFNSWSVELMIQVRLTFSRRIAS